MIASFYVVSNEEMQKYQTEIDELRTRLAHLERNDASNASQADLYRKLRRRLNCDETTSLEDKIDEIIKAGASKEVFDETVARLMKGVRAK